MKGVSDVGKKTGPLPEVRKNVRSLGNCAAETLPPVPPETTQEVSDERGKVRSGVAGDGAGEISYVRSKGDRNRTLLGSWKQVDREVETGVSGVDAGSGGTSQAVVRCPRCDGLLESWTPTMMWCVWCGQNVTKGRVS